MAGNTNQQVLNALSGPELLEVVLGKIRASLENTGEFKQHRTFPVVKLHAVVNLNIYPLQALDDDPAIKTVTEILLDGRKPIKEVEAIVDVTMDTPDKERKEAALPRTHPTLEHGVIVDKPIDPKNPPKAPKVKG